MTKKRKNEDHYENPVVLQVFRLLRVAMLRLEIFRHRSVRYIARNEGRDSLPIVAVIGQTYWTHGAVKMQHFVSEAPHTWSFMPD